VEFGIWGESPTLPESGALIYEMARRMTADGLVLPSDMLIAYESQLWRYIDNHPENSPDIRHVVEVLAYLYSVGIDHAKLREVNDVGWRRFGLEKFAASYLIGADPSSDDYDALLSEALSDFPNSSLLNKFQMARAANTAGERDAMILYVGSEFANVRENWSGPYRLSDYMASLAYELERAGE